MSEFAPDEHGSTEDYVEALQRAAGVKCMGEFTVASEVEI